MWDKEVLTKCYTWKDNGDYLVGHLSTRTPRHLHYILTATKTCNLTFWPRAFWFSAPRVENSLPVSIRDSQSLPTFRHHLKTFYFQSAYPLQLPSLPRISSSARPDSSKTSALYKSFTYLKGTSTLKNIPRKTNIYLKKNSTLFTKLTMSSLERRFLTIKITSVVQPVLQGDGSSNHRMKFHTHHHR